MTDTEKSSELEKIENKEDIVKQNNTRFLFIYTITLFFAALILIIISAMIQQRYAEDINDSINSARQDNQATIQSLNDERAELLIEIADLKQKLVEKDEIIGELTYEIENYKNR